MLPDPSIIPSCHTIFPAGHAIPLQDLLTLNPDNLDSAYADQSAWSATVQYQLSLADIEVDRADRNIKEVESSVYLETLNSWAEKTGKSPSDVFLRTLIVNDPRIKAAHETYYQWCRVRASLKAANLALAIRKDMLVNWGADRRVDRK